MLTRTLANAKEVLFSMKPTCDALRFINVPKTRLESLKTLFIDVSAMLISMQVQINVSTAQHQPFGILWP